MRASASPDAPPSQPASGPLELVGGATGTFEMRSDGARQLTLTKGRAEGTLGGGMEMRAIAAGPYKITGDARLIVDLDEARGLYVEVLEGEARVLSPGQTAVVLPAGTKKTLPPRP